MAPRRGRAHAARHQHTAARAAPTQSQPRARHRGAPTARQHGGDGGGDGEQPGALRPSTTGGARRGVATFDRAVPAAQREYGAGGGEGVGRRGQYREGGGYTGGERVVEWSGRGSTTEEAKQQHPPEDQQHGVPRQYVSRNTTTGAAAWQKTTANIPPERLPAPQIGGPAASAHQGRTTSHAVAQPLSSAGDHRRGGGRHRRDRHTAAPAAQRTGVAAHQPTSRPARSRRTHPTVRRPPGHTTEDQQERLATREPATRPTARLKQRARGRSA
mmetsp:Transcript_17802/g.50603  ORF Transcript_17802/g.50603 Transcript_17802/m.50603 type:complete len:272 (-) Transcript_17802:75-890(-)